MLSLVGGTAFAPLTPLDTVASPARAAVMACALTPALSVGEALHWVCGGYEVYDEPSIEALNTALDRVGLAPYWEKDNELEGWGRIRWLAPLLGAYPQLMPYEAVLRENPVLFSPVP